LEGACSQVPWLGIEALCSRGNDLDEGVHYGTRTVRRRRHSAHPSNLRRETRLAPPGSPLWSGLASAAQPFGVVWFYVGECSAQFVCFSFIFIGVSAKKSPPLSWTI